MSVPSDPTVSTIVHDGMREGGQYLVTPLSTPHLDFISSQFQTIKTEMWDTCKTDQLLETEACRALALGAYQVSLPTDFDDEIRVLLYDGPPDWRGTAQAATSTTITLATAVTSAAEVLRGRFIFTLTGTGANQYRLISDYDATTRVATLDSAWTTTPDNTTTYLIGYRYYELKRSDYGKSMHPAMRPMFYSRIAMNMFVHPACDQPYAILLTYRANLTRLDEDGDLLRRHLRERRSLWIQGIKTKTMARYDDDRYGLEQKIWEGALARYGAENVVYDQLDGHR